MSAAQLMTFFPWFRTICAMMPVPFCALGIWGGLKIYPPNDFMPAGVLIFFCTLSVLTALLYALALLAHWHRRRRSDPHGIFLEPRILLTSAKIMVPMPIIAMVCGLLPTAGPMLLLKLLVGILQQIDI